MNENKKLTFDDLPNAIQYLISEFEDIKNILLNNSAGTKPENILLPEKEILTVEDIATKLSIKKASVYNMTHARQIPFYKNGGRIYFDAKEINEWIRSDKRKTIKELQEEANTNLTKK